MNSQKILICLIALSLTAGCATRPRGAAYVPIVDMQGHNEYAFLNDLQDCQNYAKQTMSAAEGAVAGAIAGALLGALIAPRGYRNYAAGRVGAAGAITGGLQANDTQESITKRCLAGRGYNVLN